MRTTNYFFSGTANYFLIQVLRINFYRADNYFSLYREFIFWPTMHCELAIEGDWIECLTSSALILKTVQPDECFQRES